jgi:aspartate racemase
MINRDDIQGIILGCTELPMLIKNEDLNIYQLNTTEIHVNKIVDTIFKDKKLLTLLN